MRRSVLILTATILYFAGCFAQEGLPVQFEGNLRSDIIGLKSQAGSGYVLFHGEFDIAASLASDDLNLYKGGEFFIQGMGILGSQASARYAGDLQVFSNIENDNRLFLYQCYYKHTFKKLIIKAGQLDMNADYLVSSWASPMINSSFGVIPTISLNMPVSIFAYLAPGISVKYMPTKQSVLQTAFFSGNPGDLESNPHNLRWNLSKVDGWFNITEFQYKTKSDLRLGRYKAGFFYHSDSPSAVESTTERGGNSGFYIIGDQQLTFERNTIKNGLSMFFQLSCNLAPESMVSGYYSIGLMYRGIFRRWNEDEFTVAFASAAIGKEYRKNNPGTLSNESFIEITYKKYFLPSLIIQPDFQYIINPGATSSAEGNLTVALLRTILLF